MDYIRLKFPDDPGNFFGARKIINRLNCANDFRKKTSDDIIIKNDQSGFMAFLLQHEIFKFQRCVFAAILFIPVMNK